MAGRSWGYRDTLLYRGRSWGCHDPSFWRGQSWGYHDPQGRSWRFHNPPRPSGAELRLPWPSRQPSTMMDLTTKGEKLATCDKECAKRWTFQVGTGGMWSVGPACFKTWLKLVQPTKFLGMRERDRGVGRIRECEVCWQCLLKGQLIYNDQK
jgi:hypothetical protein